MSYQYVDNILLTKSDESIFSLFKVEYFYFYFEITNLGRMFKYVRIKYVCFPTCRILLTWHGYARLLLEKIKTHDVLAISTLIEGMCFELDMNENFVD
jgi:hypothetical protein